MSTVNTPSGVLRHNVSAMQHDIEITHALYSQHRVVFFDVLVQTLRMSAVL